MNLPKHISNPDPSIWLTNNYVVLDFETTNTDKGSALTEENRIIVGVLKWPDQPAQLYTDVYTLIEHLLDSVNNGAFLVAQNAKFELQWLKRYGVDLTTILPFDTMLAEYVLQGNNRSLRNDLGSIARRYGFGDKEPFIDICMKGGICPSEMPTSLLHDRCTLDVIQTEDVFLQQRQKLHESDRLKTLYTRCILTPVLADIEFNGLFLDGDRVVSTYREYQTSLTACMESLTELTGDVNLNSPKQLGEFIYDTLGFSELTDRRGNPLRTPTNSRRTDSATLGALKADSDEQRKFVEIYTKYNSLDAAISKNLHFFLGVVKEKAGLFFGQFNQAITQTHRLSSSGRPLLFDLFNKAKSVQFQNLPRIFKKLFTARHKGWKIGEIDGSQLEFRVAAHLGKDISATESIRSGFDVHSFTARVLTDAGEPTNRQGAKAHTFKPLYGGKSGTKAQRTYYAAFRERYPGISATQDTWVSYVLDNKQLTIPSGLTFYWPNTRQEGNYTTNTPSICNYPVQSYATADIIPIAVTYMWHKMKKLQLESFLINTIHDSVISEIHPNEIETVKEIGFESFTKDVYNYLHYVYNDDFSVPLGAEFKLGTHWSEGEEFVYTMEPPSIYN